MKGFIYKKKRALCALCENSKFGTSPRNEDAYINTSEFLIEIGSGKKWATKDFECQTWE